MKEMSQPKFPTNRRRQRNRTRPARADADSRYNTEAAYELTTAVPMRDRATREYKQEQSVHKRVASDYGLGALAVLFAIGSLLLAPIIMGPTSALLGVIAYIQGNRGAGMAAIAIGAIAFMIRLLSVVIL